MQSKSEPHTAVEGWTHRWIDSVADGRATMSQRKLTSIDSYGCGLEAVTAVAQARGVHLVLC